MEQGQLAVYLITADQAERADPGALEAYCVDFDTDEPVLVEMFDCEFDQYSFEGTDRIYSVERPRDAVVVFSGDTSVSTVAVTEKYIVSVELSAEPITLAAVDFDQLVQAIHDRLSR